MIRLYKTEDSIGISTDCKDTSTFLKQLSALLAHMIEGGLCQGSIELQLSFWLPQVVEICCKLRGHKADVTERGDLLLTCIGETAAMVASTNDITLINPPSPAPPHLEIVR